MLCHSNIVAFVATYRIVSLVTSFPIEAQTDVDPVCRSGGLVIFVHICSAWSSERFTICHSVLIMIRLAEPTWWVGHIYLFYALLRYVVTSIYPCPGVP